MKTAMNFINKLIYCLLAILMIAITFVTFYQVITRYVLNNASSWSEELVRYMFIWASLLGAAIGIREHIHIGIDVVVNQFPLPLRCVVRIIVKIAIIGMCLILVIFGIKMVGATAKQISPALHLPMKYVYLSAPVGGIFMIFYLLEGIFLDIKKWKEDKYPC